MRDRQLQRLCPPVQGLCDRHQVGSAVGQPGVQGVSVLELNVWVLPVGMRELALAAVLRNDLSKVAWRLQQRQQGVRVCVDDLAIAAGSHCVDLRVSRPIVSAHSPPAPSSPASAVAAWPEPVATSTARSLQRQLCGVGQCRA
jgi:hypothetical protein